MNFFLIYYCLITKIKKFKKKKNSIKKYDTFDYVSFVVYIHSFNFIIFFSRKNVVDDKM